jgi:uncharacterized membrane protein
MVLKGKWMKAVAILLLVSLLTLGFVALEAAFRSAFKVPLYYSDGSMNITVESLIIEAVFAVLVLLFMPPLFTGQAEWYWNLTAESSKGIGEVFGWFGSLRLYLKSVALSLNIFIRCLLWAIPLCVLPVGVIATGYYFFTPVDLNKITLNTSYFVLTVSAGYLLLAFALIVLLGIAIRYFLAVFLLVDDNTRKIREVMRASVKYSKGRRWEMTKFCLSFILWFFTCYLYFPALFVLPYFNSSSTIFAKHLIFTGRAKEKKADAPKTAEA